MGGRISDLLPGVGVAVTMDWSKTRVLLIHSDIHVRRWAHDVLHRQKVASVQSTRSPATGLALLARFAADVAVVQLCQSEMNGAEFVRRLRDPERSPRPQLPVVIIADVNNPLLGKAQEAGIDGVIIRPMTVDVFLERIAVAASTRRPAAITDRRDRRPITNPAPAAPARLAASDVPQRLAAPAHRDRIEMSDRPVAMPRPPIPLALPAAAPVPRHGTDEWADAVAPETVAAPADTTLDIGPILAEHTVWLLSHGEEGSRAQLEGADLHGRSLAKTNLSSAGLREADLSDADCRQAIFVSADLRRADFSAADLSGADLSVANLRGTGLRMARLAGASLRGANLAGACLSDAVLDDTDLAGANLLGADLRKSDLSGAVGLTQEQVAKARADASTRMPPGIRLRDPEELPPVI
ncbi:MAG: pentapeptide repeat-containing protein [Rhodospirillales bacterium]|nr:pentapeptide repeat-containing protein [Rhodospirillales bacterium]